MTRTHCNTITLKCIWSYLLVILWETTSTKLQCMTIEILLAMAFVSVSCTGCLLIIISCRTYYNIKSPSLLSYFPGENSLWYFFLEKWLLGFNNVKNILQRLYTIQLTKPCNSRKTNELTFLNVYAKTFHCSITIFYCTCRFPFQQFSLDLSGFWKFPIDHHHHYLAMLCLTLESATWILSLCWDLMQDYIIVNIQINSIVYMILSKVLSCFPTPSL